MMIKNKETLIKIKARLYLKRRGLKIIPRIKKVKNAAPITPNERDMSIGMSAIAKVSQRLVFRSLNANLNR